MASKVTQNQFRKLAREARKRLAVGGSTFENDSPAARLRRKAEGIVLPERFNAIYLGHYFRSAPAPFHLELYRALEEWRRIVARAPRGHAKSTVLTFSYTLHQVVCARELRAWAEGRLEEEDPALYQAILEVMAEELERRVEVARAQLDGSAESDAALNEALAARVAGIIPLFWDPYIQIVSVTEDTAQEFTEAIQQELETNELLRSDWGTLIEPRQAASDWVSLTDVRVKAFGMMSAVRGGKHRQWRPTLAMVDDPDSEETIGTTRLRDKQLRKLTAGIAFGLEPKVGRIFVAGTPIHGDCLVCRLTRPEYDRRWKKLRYRAILPDNTPLWPDRWTVEALREEEEGDPEAFAMEMLDTPPSSGKPYEVIHYYDRAEWENAALPKVMIFDPSMGKSETSDYQAIVFLRGPTPAGDILVHRCELLRIGDPLQLMQRVDQLREEEQPDMAVVETIGFQAVLLSLSGLGSMGHLMADWLRIESQSESKDLRLRGLAPSVNSGRIKFPSDKSCRNLEAQALDYPDGKRDGLDAMEMGVRQMRQRRRRRQEIRHHPRERADWEEGARSFGRQGQKARKSRRW